MRSPSLPPRSPHSIPFSYQPPFCVMIVHTLLSRRRNRLGTSERTGSRPNGPRNNRPHPSSTNPESRGMDVTLCRFGKGRRSRFLEGSRNLACNTHQFARQARTAQVVKNSDSRKSSRVKFSSTRKKLGGENLYSPPHTERNGRHDAPVQHHKGL